MNKKVLIAFAIIVFLLVVINIGFAAADSPSSVAANPPLVNHALDLNAGLIAYYKLDGDADDSSGNGHHGTPSSGVTFSAGRKGQAAFFDGSTELRITVPDHNDFDSDYNFTISAWVKPIQYRSEGGTNNYHMIISKWWTSPTCGDYHFDLTHGASPGLPKLVVANTDAGFTTDTLIGSSDHAVPLNRWSHVAATFDAGSMRLFLNCKPVGEKVSTSVTHTELAEYPYDYITMGNHRTNALYEYGFIGSVDEVRLYNRTLSETEICQLTADVPWTYVYLPVIMRRYCDCCCPPCY